MSFAETGHDMVTDLLAVIDCDFLGSFKEKGFLLTVRYPLCFLRSRQEITMFFSGFFAHVRTLVFHVDTSSLKHPIAYCGDGLTNHSIP